LPPSYWEVLSQFNSLRNALAHRLEAKDIEERVDRLYQRMVADDDPRDRPPDLPPEVDHLGAVIAYLVHGMKFNAVVHESLEKYHEAMVRKGLRSEA
jgi:hypothetical protein